MASGAAFVLASQLLPSIVEQTGVQAGDGGKGKGKGDREVHLAWVWQFDTDGDAASIRDVLSRNDLGIILKTHDGTRWMSTWDSSPSAVNGPGRISELRDYFESAGVPFHAWCVITGRDPAAEARLCSDVLAAGARSLYLDLEPPEGNLYGQGTPADAIAFGRELRQRQPYSLISLAPDPRPWQLEVLPMREFAAFADEIAPQSYWRNFDSTGNYRLLRQYGFNVGDEGVTPELVLDVSKASLEGFGLPIRPIGVGSTDTHSWRRFIQHAYALGMDMVSVWRYGVSHPDLWPLLQEMAPRLPEAVEPPAVVVEQPAQASVPPAEEVVVPPAQESMSVEEPPVESVPLGQPEAEGEPGGVLPWKTVGGALASAAGAAMIGGKGVQAEAQHERESWDRARLRLDYGRWKTS